MDIWVWLIVWLILGLCLVVLVGLGSFFTTLITRLSDCLYKDDGD